MNFVKRPRLLTAGRQAFEACASMIITAATAVAQDRVVDTEVGPLRVQSFAGGLEHPWGLVFLPDGSLLVTERPGRLRRIATSGVMSEPLDGVPAVFAEGQGGLLDVALDPNFKRNRLVYLSYSEPGSNGTAGTAVARGRLQQSALKNVQIIYRQQPKVDGGNHFGSRLVFGPGRTLFITLGERFKFDPAQDLASALGKIVRIKANGQIPADNPFVNRRGIRPEIWSYGHRNVEGAALNPWTGQLWTSELGPMGGDELNVARAGKNYGWPLVSWGNHYTGQIIPRPTTRPDLSGSRYKWSPVISPSGIAFYNGSMLPEWTGNLLIGGLSEQALVRLTLNGGKIASEERIALGQRIRAVAQAPDGAVYLLTDESPGEILRITPGR